MLKETFTYLCLIIVVCIVDYSLSFSILKKYYFFNYINKIRSCNLKITINNEIKDNIIIDYNNGSNQYKIADRYKIAQSIVSRIIKKARESGNYEYIRKPVTNIEIIDYVITDYNSGSKQKDIATKYNLSRTKVCNILIKARESGIYDNLRTPTIRNIELIRKIIIEYINGSYQSDIAKKYNISPQSVYSIIKSARESGKYGYVRTSKTIITNEIKDNVITDWNDGRTQINIAQTYNISHATVKNIIKRARESDKYKYIRTRNINPRATITIETKDNIITDYNNGSSQIKVANKYNISPQSVSYTIRKARKNGKYGYVRTSKTIITDEIEDNIISNFYNRGLTYGEIANNYNISQAIVGNILKKYRKNSSYRSLKPSNLITNLIKDNNNNNSSKYIEIVNKYNTFTKAKYIKGTNRKTPILITDKVLIDNIITDCYRGINFNTIAIKYNINKSNIHNILKIARSNSILY